MQYTGLFLVLVILVGSIKIVIQTPWGWDCGMHIPKKIVSPYFVLTVLFFQCIFLYFFTSPKEMNFFLVLSCALGFPAGAISLFFYLQHLKIMDKKIKKEDIGSILIGFPVGILAIFILSSYLEKLGVSI